jgi:ribosomal protein S18 acetylase RimI-like enzyme
MLDNVTWHALAGPHEPYAAGNDRTRRYVAGFAPIVGFADPQQPDFTALEAVCDVGGQLYCGGWAGAVPRGWRIERELTLIAMLWSGVVTERDTVGDIVDMGARHLAEATALIDLTAPGPFGPRAFELGDYVGIYAEGRLVAMAGERMCAGALREISCVCTHPDWRGRALANRLMSELVRRQLQRKEIPFLHVTAINATARRLYEWMGFVPHSETVLRLISRIG